MIEHERHGDVAVLRMTQGENLFNDAFLAALNAGLDALESDDSAGAVVLTGAGKFFSNGFDLEFLGSRQGPALMDFIFDAQQLLARILVYPMPTVAAVNGHAFGIGAMLALAADQRLMRRDRGWVCFPEIDLGLGFQPFMTALIATRLADAAASEAVLTGRRYAGEEAVAAGIANLAVEDHELLDRAAAAAASRAGKGRDVTARIKRELYAPVLARLQR
jgi:enoyl-CoA hydratase/carnithine racemase